MAETESIQTAYVARHYAKAPIREAILEIQIDASPAVELSYLDGLEVALGDAYPTRDTMMAGHLTGRIGAGEVTATAQQRKIGYRLRSSDGLQIVQARLNGFAFSRLAPYQDWIQMRTEAARIWGLYRSLLPDHKITQLGVRCINQLDIPLPIRDFREYLRTFPEVSADLPQALSTFVMHLQIPQIDIDAMLTLNEAMVPPPKPDMVSVIIDIDVIKGNLSLEAESAIWTTLDILHVRRNETFEACITNNTRRFIS